ncbi:ADP-ribosylation factor-related protein 1 [Hordeum vulgare]|nr:ADP-ribosylation factor-related protein 1 [Hordeum vulgare]
MWYITMDICHHYWERATTLLWSDAHLRNNSHLSADKVTIPPIPVSGRTHREEIDQRASTMRRSTNVIVPRLPPDLLYDRRYAMDSPLWNMWLRNEHDHRRQSFFTGRLPSPLDDVVIPELEMAVKEVVREELVKEEVVEELPSSPCGNRDSWVRDGCGRPRWDR